MNKLSLTTTLALLIATLAIAVTPVTAAPASSRLGAALIGGAWASVTQDQVTAVVHGPGDLVSLNPQPLPPRYLTRHIGGDFGSKVMLNPQPLPPRQLNFGS
ncbi:MAG: hypothetical protein ABI216_08750 [Devosia sp.]